MSRLFERRLLARTAITVALLALLAWRIDLSEAGRALRDANYVFILPAVVCFGLAKLLVSQRWRVMMSTFATLPLMPLFGILCVSNLANNVLPARLGDLIRVQVPAQRYGMSRARLAATVFATESLLDGIALGGLGLIGLALIDLQGFPTEVFWGILGLLAGCLVAVVPLSHVKLEGGWTGRSIVQRLPDRIQRALEEAVPAFLDGLAVFRHGRLGLQAIALSFGLWLLEVAMFVLLGLAFGIHLSMPAWMVTMVAANLITAVPVTPSNIGAYEVAITELLKALGVDAGAAAGFAIAAHVFNILWITAAGFVAMWSLGLGLDDVFSFRTKPAVALDESPEAAGAPG
ncbi:MAG TPA: lysylphosphatidylglycerol synthase transmembrane domain-containing protein [Dehalococcoidia bacterium]|nr:lysylphosphatidylglycerol synthase transmembrane domain-containing protein [Dehalococcoidia bacterium]